MGSEVAVEEPAPVGLDEVLDILNRSSVDNEEQLQALLGAIQEACSGLAQLVEGGGSLPTELLGGALEAVAHGLSTARQHLERAAGQLAALQGAAPWSQALLAAADACLHSERWHAAWHAEAAGGKEAYARTVALARDMLKQDLLPLLCDAAAQQTGASGFCLAPQYQALLAMGRTAAEIVGMRDARHRRPGLRNFSVLNVLWNGIQRLWTAVPEDARPDMERQGLGAAAVVGALLGFVRKDIRACHQLLDPGVGKLLQYWVQKAAAVLASYPGAAPACWQALVEVPLSAHQELALLSLKGAAEGANAAALAEALRGKVVPGAVRLLVACLGGATAEDQLRVMLDALRMHMSRSEQPSQAVHALRTVLQLLHSSPGLPPLARHHCVPLLGGVLDALPGAAYAAALHSPELREQVADAALVFLATCCRAAATAPGNEALQAWERSLMAQTWERCQQQLFLHALQPHPLTAHMLACVWSDLAAVASEPLLKAHITALHDLLRLAAAAEAAGGHGPPSPLYMQLLALLACLLAAGPPATLDAYFANFLQMLPSMREDACQLACLAAELRLAALVDGATGAGAAARQVQAVLRHLFALLHETGPAVMKRLCGSSGGPEGPGGAAAAGQAEGVYLAWLLEAVQCAAAYIARTDMPQEDGGALLASLSSRLVTLLTRTVGRGVFACAAPALAALRDLRAYAPLAPQELEALVPVLAACLQRPELAAVAAELAPAFARCAAPHAELLHAALSAQPPLLRHLGLEGFRLYAKACPSANVAAALPPSLRNPGTGAVVESFATLLQQYTQRCPGSSSYPSDQDAAAWAAALREEALGATAALRRVLEAHRVLAAATGGGEAAASAGQLELQHQKQERRRGAEGSSGVPPAVQQLVRSVSQLEAALRGGQGGSLDCAAAREVQQCLARLSHLMPASGIVA